jgi:hypothetical protein
MHTPTKFISMISAIGRCPASAAPTAAPMIAASLIGVARMRCSPYFSVRPEVQRLGHGDLGHQAVSSSTSL